MDLASGKLQAEEGVLVIGADLAADGAAGPTEGLGSGSLAGEFHGGALTGLR